MNTKEPKTLKGATNEEVLRELQSRMPARRRELQEKFDFGNDEIFEEVLRAPQDTLHDQIKWEHLIKVWDKYTPEQMEAALPE